MSEETKKILLDMVVEKFKGQEKEIRKDLEENLTHVECWVRANLETWMTMVAFNSNQIVCSYDMENTTKEVVEHLKEVFLEK